MPLLSEVIMDKIRGVNLGGWLVLEKWMTPELYESYEAEDEYNLLKQLNDPLEVIKKHRDSFITEEDFLWIKNHQIDYVRIPIGHWLFDAKAPYISAKEYLDKAFIWANKYGLKVMIDVHAALGCQNGFDNGGLSGIMTWHLYQENIDRTLEFIKDLCDNYGKESQLFAIQLLNEPHISIDISIIKNFYFRGYEIVRENLGDDIAVVFHDAFRLEQWEDFFTEHKFRNVYLDTHMYQSFGEVKRNADIYEIVDFIVKKRVEKIKNIRDFTRIIIGEWSSGLLKEMLETVKDEIQKKAYKQVVSGLLLLAFEEADGWFFWNYKLSEKSTQLHSGWSFKYLVENDLLPFAKKGV